MKYVLREYQNRDVENLRGAFRAGYTSPIYVLPTAGGKTVVFCHIAENAAAKENRVMILVHRKELLEQASEKLDEIGTPHGVIAQGRTMTGDLVQVASVDTLIRRLDRVPRPDLLVIDEAHHAVPGNKWGRVISHFKCRILGVTATPIRMQGAGLGKQVGGFFDLMVQGPTIQDLIAAGFLSAPLTFAPPVKVDLSGLRMQNGDYEKHDLNLRMDKDKITGDAVEHYKRICPGQPAIAFCVSISHAEHVAAKFNAAGIRAAMISGAMDNKMREFRIRALGNGQIKVLTSCEIISEGTDIPVVSAAILLRPTKSTGLYIQQCGRALRIFPGKKNTYILDHVGNTHRFGLVDEPRGWTLDADPRRKNNPDELIIRLRSCPKCYSVFPIYKMTCPQCGTATVKQEREIEEVAGDLELINREKMQEEFKKREALKERAAASTYEALEQLARQRGYKPGWARYVWQARIERKNRLSPEG